MAAALLEIEMADAMIGSASADTHGESDAHGYMDESQPCVFLQGLMRLRNDEQSKDTMCSHMSQLARTSTAFNAVGYDMSEVREAADALVDLDVITLRQLLDKESVFIGGNPGWAYAENESIRSVAEIFPRSPCQHEDRRHSGQRT